MRSELSLFYFYKSALNNNLKRDIEKRNISEQQ